MARTRELDACPGTLRVHQAADGGVARVRLPGGRIAPGQLRALTRVAAESGSPTLQLTSRGSLQLRGLTDIATLTTTAAEHGLLPSPDHDHIRNITASPLSGLQGGLTDVRPLVDALDRALIADPSFVRLPGRFWFSVDDGRGDVSGLGADIGVHAVDDGTVALLLMGEDTGVRLAITDVVPAVIEVARRFQRIRANRWRVAELDHPQQLVTGFSTVSDRRSFARPAPPPVGWIEQRDGPFALGAAVPLGVLTVEAAYALSAIGHPLVITPWRTLLVCGLGGTAAVRAVQRLTQTGLVFDAHSPWLHVSACVGSPGCRKSAADVRADVTAIVLAGKGPQHRQHWVGCARGCGSPAHGEVLVASDTGYQLLPHGEDHSVASQPAIDSVEPDHDENCRNDPPTGSTEQMRQTAV
ncbi:MAG: precorrin-3B synthase [Actinobacteria bacterium]|nr:precorrin-3B synthase [Actinomycetota bacterium]